VTSALEGHKKGGSVTLPPFRFRWRAQPAAA
jgi:hypothetical protein